MDGLGVLIHLINCIASGFFLSRANCPIGESGTAESDDCGKLIADWSDLNFHCVVLVDGERMPWGGDCFKLIFCFSSFIFLSNIVDKFI